MNVFEMLYVSWRRERYSKKLEKLDTDFYEKIRPYLLHLETQVNNEEDEIVASIFKKRWQRANYILNDLISIRLEKHFHDSIHSINLPEIIPLEELRFRKSIDKIQSQFRDTVIKGIEIEEDEPELSGEDLNFMIFTKNETTVSIGRDFSKLGPFIENDIVLLPKENLRSFMLKDMGKDIEIA